ncbi:beta-ketoacyl synthase N-terminal-like domain-containing protein [Thermodesulfobacteriota bacterium]
MSEPRAFITGLGIVSPAGTGCKETLEALQKGIRAFRPLTCFTTSSGKSPLPAGEVRNLPSGSSIPRTHIMAIMAAREAVAGESQPPDAIVLGGTTGGMPYTEELLKARTLEPGRFGLHGTGSVADTLAEELGCIGPVLTVSTACASGTAALIIALELIRSGKAERVLTGGADALCRLTYYGFGMLQLIDPQGARPFDRDRAGMTVGEGAAMLMVAAGTAPPDNSVAELLGGGLSCDAYHPSAPHPEGSGALDAMKHAISDAGILRTDIDYISLHGTGTPDNDASEARAIVTLFGEDVPFLSSTKGTFGHSLAAAGAMEAVTAALCIKHGLVPGNIGCSEPDPELRIRPILSPRKADVKMVLSNSFGFGGNNASVVLGRPRTETKVRPRGETRKLAVLGSACITGAGNTRKSLSAFKSNMPLLGALSSEEITRGLSPKDLRRMKRLPRMALALATAALADCSGENTPRAIFLGTGWGPLSETGDFLTRLFKTNEKFSSPIDFVGSVHNAIAGQIAIRLNATGTNITTTGGDASFEQALFMDGLFSRREDDISLLIGADEAHPLLTPLFDPSTQHSKPLSDGGGAILVKPVTEWSGVTLFPAFFQKAHKNPDVIDSMLAALGGKKRLARDFGALFVGMPAAYRRSAEKQLARFLLQSDFSGPIIDYRPVTGEYATASATATVIATRLLTEDTIPAVHTEGADYRLDGRGILLLGLGETITVVEAGH